MTWRPDATPIPGDYVKPYPDTSWVAVEVQDCHEIMMANLTYRTYGRAGRHLHIIILNIIILRTATTPALSAAAAAAATTDAAAAGTATAATIVVVVAAATTNAFEKRKLLLYVAINNGDAQPLCLPLWLYALVVADITRTLK